jgi:hypothetical protein
MPLELTVTWVLFPPELTSVTTPAVGRGNPGAGPPTTTNVPETVARCGCALGVEEQAVHTVAALINTANLTIRLVLILFPRTGRSQHFWPKGRLLPISINDARAP